MADSFYETEKALSEYLLFHYGPEEVFLEQGIGPKEALDFAKRCGQLHRSIALTRGRALDLGCAVGGSSFELSASFGEVVGIDFSHALIDSARILSKKLGMAISVAVEGDIRIDLDISLSPNSQPPRVRFEQGDAMNLKKDLGTFDFVLMANLIDRLPHPRQCLERIHSFVNQGGVLAIVSPYTWLEEYTPKENWLGGYYRDGDPVRTIDTLKKILSPKFEFLSQADMPFLIREHCRKNQFSIAEATLWRLR